MLTLLLDTSTERAIVAIAFEETVIFSRELPFGLQNSKFLVPTIHEGLTGLGYTPKDLGQIVCGKGPGSYTGLRVAAAVAQSLAYALSIPLIGVSALQAFIPDVDGPFASVIDAKMGGLYVSLGKMCEGVVHYTLCPTLLALTAELPRCCITPCSISLAAKLPDQVWIERAPDARQMLLLARSKDPFALLYLQEWQPSFK